MLQYFFKFRCCNDSNIIYSFEFFLKYFFVNRFVSIILTATISFVSKSSHLKTFPKDPNPSKSIILYFFQNSYSVEGRLLHLSIFPFFDKVFKYILLIIINY